MIGVYLLSFSFILLRSILVYLKSGSRLTCFLIFLHFLQKYRCVPKIAFSADISIDIFIDISIHFFIGISIDISIDMFIYIYSCISIDMFIDIYIDVFLDIPTDDFIDIYIDMFTDMSIDISIDISIGISIDIYIDILTGKEGRREEKEGVDFFLKSNNPTPTGGELTKMQQKHLSTETSRLQCFRRI